MFSGVNYKFWKVRMKIFIESIDRGIWNAIVNGPYIPMTILNDVPVQKSFDLMQRIRKCNMIVLLNI